MRPEDPILRVPTAWTDVDVALFRMAHVMLRGSGKSWADEFVARKTLMVDAICDRSDAVAHLKTELPLGLRQSCHNTMRCSVLRDHWSVGVSAPR